MKKINKTKLLIVAVIISFTACTVDFGDTNVNSNNPSESVPSALLTGAQRNVSGVIAATTPNLYVQYLSNGQYDDESRYQTLNWGNAGFYGILQDLKEIVSVNTSDEKKVDAQAYGSNANQIAASNILGAWFFNIMTDRWGALPYSESLRLSDGIVYPKYDTQETIYDGLFAQLDNAMGMIDSGRGPVGDILFGGDMTKWRTFANTIKLTMALRLSKADPAKGKAKFLEAMTGAISSNEQNIKYTYLSEDTNDNPWEDRFQTRKDYLMSEVFVNKLIGDGTNTSPDDPRLPKMADLSEEGSIYIGAPYGVINSATDNYSFITKNIIEKGNAPLMVYTYAEVLFARAEAAALGWTTEDAASLFNQGIMASMEQWGVITADATAYANSKIYGSIPDIAYERWVAQFLQGYNSWAEWRRAKSVDTEANIGLVPPSKRLSGATGIPQRHAYAATAASNNKINYNNAIAAQGPDDLNTILWIFK